MLGANNALSEQQVVLFRSVSVLLPRGSPKVCAEQIGAYPKTQATLWLSLALKLNQRPSGRQKAGILPSLSPSLACPPQPPQRQSQTDLPEDQGWCIPKKRSVFILLENPPHSVFHHKDPPGGLLVRFGVFWKEFGGGGVGQVSGDFGKNQAGFGKFWGVFGKVSELFWSALGGIIVRTGWFVGNSVSNAGFWPQT